MPYAGARLDSCHDQHTAGARRPHPRGAAACQAAAPPRRSLPRRAADAVAERWARSRSAPPSSRCTTSSGSSTTPDAMTDLPAATRDELVGELLPKLSTPVRRPADDGDDRQDPLAAVRRRPRRERAHALPRPRHDLRLQPGRLRHELPVLRDRPGRPDPQHVDRRDRRAGRRRRPRARARRDRRRPTRGRPAAGQNVVFMGMGEALANYKAAIGAIRRLADRRRRGSGISARGITMSTVGLVPAIDRLAAEGIPVTLALSLHAPDDELRDELVPINTRWKVGEALDAARPVLRDDRPAGVDRVRPDPRHQRPGLAGRPAGPRADPARHGWVHVNPIPLNPTPGLELDGQRPGGRARVRRAAASARRADDRPRHPRPRHRRRLRPARRRHALTPAALTPRRPSSR